MVKFELPGKDERGYLKRMRSLGVSQDDAASQAERWDAIVEYLLAFVVEPKDKDEAREALWEFSENQYNAAMDEIKRLGEVSKNT